MNLGTSLALMALAVSLTSCATPPSRAFHNTDPTALVVESFDLQTSQILQPTASARMNNDKLLAAATKLPQHQTAVVILENYFEPEIGDEFRDRSEPWVVGLKNLGYQRLVFLKGLDVPSPEQLITLIEY